MRAPVHTACTFVQRLGRWRSELRDRQQHAIRDTRPEARAVGMLERTRAFDARAQRFDFGRTKCGELGGREVGGAGRRSNEETVKVTQRNALGRTTQLLGGLPPPGSRLSSRISWLICG